jgi:hypothetical protein
MSDEPVTTGIDTSRPSIARVYDYFLGGKDNFAVDRAMVGRVLQIAPDAPEGGQINRAFLRRVVRHLAGEAGIRQFLDIGSGLPTRGNVHEIAHQMNPAARVVYVDNDPMALAHGRALLADSHTTTVLQADLREPERMLADPELRSFIDFDQPVGLLMFAILHHINDDEDPASIAARLRAAVPSGSYLAISHFHNPGEKHPELSRRMLEGERVFNQTLGTGRWRTYEEILAYFGDFEMVEPGLVPMAEWRPDPGESVATTSNMYYTFLGGVARKP